MLSGTLEHADQCNGARADAQLREIPTEDPVYKRHSPILYRMRFIEKFPAITNYLNDQSDGEHNAKMTKFAAKMKKSLAEKSAGVQDDNPDYKKQLAAAQQSIDDVVKWGSDERMYWALELLYYTQRSSLPTWNAMYTSGAGTSTLGMFQKQLNSLFGILEDNKTNTTTTDAKNFTQTFNEDMRLFQMTSCVPQLLDLDGNSSDFDDLLVQCLWDYKEHFKTSPDKNHQEAVQAAEELYAKFELRQKMFAPLAQASRLGQAAGSWNLITAKWEQTVINAPWFQKLQGASRLFATFQIISSAALIIFGLIPSVRATMTDQQKIQWAL